MNLAGRLEDTTIGDVLGTIARADACGELRLRERNGRAHWIALKSGDIVAAHADCARAPLFELLRRAGTVAEPILRRSLLRALASGRLHGEVLVRDFGVSADAIAAALAEQALAALRVLENVKSAQLSFHPSAQIPIERRLPRPLGRREYLHGRRRARDVVAGASAPHMPPMREQAGDRTQALAVLGLAPGATPYSVRSAYRQLVQQNHPDVQPPRADQQVRNARLRAAADAYHFLRAESEH